MAQAGELGLALLLSAVIGLEREVRQKSAGLRTYTLVGVGSALFMLISKYGFSDAFGPAPAPSGAGSLHHQGRNAVHLEVDTEPVAVQEFYAYRSLAGVYHHTRLISCRVACAWFIDARRSPNGARVPPHH